MTVAVACLAFVATHQCYFMVGDVRVMFILAPLAACATLFGPLVGMVVGAITGLAEFACASRLPLNYYDTFLSIPLISVGGLAFAGFAMGVLFSHVGAYRGQERCRRLTVVALCCALASTLFSLLLWWASTRFCVAGEYGLPASLSVQAESGSALFFQWLADFALMSLFVAIAEFACDGISLQAKQRTIRETFQAWLAVVVTVAYLVCASLSFMGISMLCRSDAERRLDDELLHLQGQLLERDEMLTDVSHLSNVPDGALEEVHRSSIVNVASDFAITNSSVCIVGEDGLVVTSTDESCLDKPFYDLVRAGLLGGPGDATFDGASSFEWLTSDGSLYYVRVAELPFSRAGRSGTYQLMVSVLSEEAYAYRAPMMAVVSAAFVLIFVSVYLQASLLLQNVVVRGFDKTNRALSNIIDGDLNERVNVHDTLEFDNLSEGINTTVGVLKNSLAETQARINRELMTAQAIQRSALPDTFPPFPDIEQFDVYASMDPAREVGGDFYNLFLIDDHTLGFLIADVSGKGIPAALFMMAAQTEIENYMSSGISLAQAIESANYHLCQGNDTGTFVTVWAGKLDWESGKLTYVNAGHNPPFLKSDGVWRPLRRRGGTILGCFEQSKYHEYSLTLQRGDQLLFYTDGVTEAFSADQEQYGEERLESYLSLHTKDHPHALVDGVRSDVAQWAEGAEQSDDITLLSLEFGVAPEVMGSITVDALIGNLGSIRAIVHDELAKRLCPITVQNQIDIALEEFFVNICKYAYDEADAPGKCRLDYVYNANPNAITIQLTDWGKPFDPLEARDPSSPASLEDAKIGGLGIFIARKSVDDLSYLRDGDSNVLAFRKNW